MSSPLFYFLLFVAYTSSLAGAHIGDFDETWKRRSEEARATAFAAYEPKPNKVVDHVNHHVHRSFLEMDGNSTRRQLRHRKHTGPCKATNPIDRCWRCDPYWHLHRKRLANCVLGFGRKTKGGKRGKYYVVFDPSDDDLVNPKPGTLRYAVTRKEPLWIIFANDMVIQLSEELIVADYKTIDGRGHQIHIAYGGQITIQFVKHVIIHGLHIHDLKSGSGGMIRDSVDHFGQRTTSDGDGISIFGSSHVWVDHVSMSNCMDGLIDAIAISTAITISNSHFTNHNEVMLFGASNANAEDKVMQITLAFNHFGRGLKQRMPRGRFGFFHVVNNDYTHWQMYAIGGSQNPTIISQGNRYIAPHVTNPEHNATEVTKREFTPESVWKHWIWKSEGDLLKNDAFFVQSGPKKVHLPFSGKDMISAKPGEYVTRLTRYSGTLACRKGLPC